MPAIHAVSHVDHEKRVACLSISVHAYNCGALLGGPSGHWSSIENLSIYISCRDQILQEIKVQTGRKGSGITSFAWLIQHLFFIMLWTKVQTSHIPYLSSQGKMSVSH